MKYLRLVLLLLTFIGSTHTYAQAPIADFSIPSTACINESIQITNLSSDAVQTNWDFCEEDLLMAPSFTDMGVVGASGGLIDLRLANDNGSWYGFVCDGAGMKLKKLFFGNSLSNTPTQTDVASFNLPAGVEIVKFKGNWFGIVGTYLLPSELHVLQFGSSLANAPVITKANLPPNAILSSRSLSVVQEGDDLIVFVANKDQQAITRINFGNSFSNANPIVDLISVTSSYLFGIDVIEASSKKYMILTDFASNKVIKLSFGTDWKTTSPVTEIVSTGAVTLSNPTIVNWQFEGGNYYAFVVLNSGGSYKLTFGADLTNNNPTIQSIGVFGDMNNINGMHLVRHEGHFTSIFTSYTTNKIYRMDFVDPGCTASTPYFEGAIPPLITFPSPGNKLITVRANGTGLQSDRLTKTIAITATPAPQINMHVINKQCLSQDNEFTIDSDQTISNFDWSFGDQGTSNSATALYSYSSPGRYEVGVYVTSVNGCHNRAKSSITVNSAPDFLIPIVTPVCTNTSYDFNNATTFDSNYEPSWVWKVNGSVLTNEKNLTHTFSSTGPQEIRLSLSTNECVNEVIRSFMVTGAGSSTDYINFVICQEKQTQFVNKSASDITSSNWDFGDGTTSGEFSPQHTYATANLYQVKLTTINASGCANQKSNLIQVYSKPQPDFSLDLPPFSCAGTLSQFNDLTTAPTDSNISSWGWSFGDNANGTSIIKNPTYTYGLAGSYDVLLKVTTNFGCEATKLKTIQIAESPKASFIIGATCLNQPTYFTDASSGTNKGWLWKIGNSSYTLQNPAHVFSGTGNYTAQLTVTANNNCISVLSKPIHVPVPPNLDFSVQNNCAGLATVFEDVTVQNADPAVSRVWDFGGKGIGNGASTQFSFPTPGTYNVKLTVINQSGCSYALSKNASIVAAPVANFLTSVESGPPPLDVKFTNTSLNASAFQWQFNDATNSTSVEVSPSFTYTSLGDFVVDLIASNAQGCIDKKSKIIHAIIPYTEIELEEFTLLHDATTGSVRPVLTIKNNSNYTISSINVVLDIAGNASVKEKINTSILPNASSSQILNYELLPGGSQLKYLCAEVQLTDDADPVNNSECISLQSEAIVFSPYPNPVQEQLSVDWIGTSEDAVKVTVMTQTGQVAYQKEIKSVGLGLNQIVLDFSQLNSGFYILLFESPEVRKTFPIVIQN